MHLNGEVVLRVDELYQHREVLKTAAVLAEDALTLCRYVVGKGLSIELAAGDNALTVLVAGKLPAFRNSVGIELLAVFLTKSVAAPDVVLAGRFKL